MSDWHQGLRKMFSVYALCMCACLCRCVCVCVCCVYVPASVGVGVCGCLCCYVCVLYMRACVLACVWNTTCMTSTKIFALTSSVSKALWVCMTNTNITYCTDLQCVGFISLCDHALTCSVSKALSVCVTMPWPAVCQRLYQSVWPCTDLQCVEGFINLCDHALTSSVSKALSVCVTMHWPPVCRRLYQSVWPTQYNLLHWPLVCQMLYQSVWPCTDLQCVEGFINLSDQVSADEGHPLRHFACCHHICVLKGSKCGKLNQITPLSVCCDRGQGKCLTNKPITHTHVYTHRLAIVSS